MPYIPINDRPVLDELVSILANDIATKLTNNFSLKNLYVQAFSEIIFDNDESKYEFISAKKLGDTIIQVAKKYNYEGAFLGELNYAITRLIQEVPKAVVALGKWKEELRYWIYAVTVDSLINISNQNWLPIGVAGVFEDIKDEYKRRVNPAYEAVQIIKSGDCYDTPYHTVLVNAEGINTITGKKIIGYQEIMVDFRIKKFFKKFKYKKKKSKRNVVKKEKT